MPRVAMTSANTLTRALIHAFASLLQPLAVATKNTHNLRARDLQLLRCCTRALGRPAVYSPIATARARIISLAIGQQLGARLLLLRAPALALSIVRELRVTRALVAAFSAPRLFCGRSTAATTMATMAATAVARPRHIETHAEDARVLADSSSLVATDAARQYRQSARAHVPSGERRMKAAATATSD